jgi:glycosyltransferase involved in cell wall biosynthesis
MNKRITIITINYNNFEGLKKTFESLSAQTWQDFEYIVIDGGSTDGSLKLLEKNTSLISYWVSEPDKGVYHAMNKGIEKAKGEYLLFLNSGDHFFNKKVLAKSEHLIKDYDLIYFNQYVIGKTKKFIKEYPETLSFAHFLKDNIPHQATFIKKELFKIVGLFKEDFKIVADWKFFLDCVCKYNTSYRHVNKVLTVFYQDGMSSFPENMKVIYDEKHQVLNTDYKPYLQDLEEVLKYKTIIYSLRRSRIIKWLIKLGFLNKF